jgi:hypothetical protein
MLHRAQPELPPAIALNSTEVSLLDELVKTKPGFTDQATISDYIIKIARLGGYLAAPQIRRRGTWSCGEASLDSPTSSWASRWSENLWVIEST